MVFQVPESKRSLNQNQFEFQLPGDDTVYRIPKAKYLTSGEVEKLSNSTRVTFSDILTLFGKDEAAATAIRELDTDQLEALMNAYTEASGMSLGESSASM